MKHLAALKEQVGIQLQRAGRILLVDLVLEGGQAGYRRVVRQGLHVGGQKARVQIGYGIVAQMHLLHAASSPLKFCRATKTVMLITREQIVMAVRPGLRFRFIRA